MPRVPVEYENACNYPATLDEAAVNDSLRRYCAALGVKRDVRQLRWPWWKDKALVDDVVIDVFMRMRSPIAASAASAASAAFDARAARDARDARDALAALDALDARDALAALDAVAGGLQRFAAWCIQAYGWWFWRFDLSWLSTTAFGARQLKKPEVSAWSEPILEAFVAGAWMVYWTDDTLYWVAKPTVHKESFANGRRLHHEKYAALESDVEDLYFWHGVLVPAFVVVRPDWITIKHISQEPNAEVRRVMIERYGEARYIEESGMKPVASDDVFGDLYIENLNVGRPIAKLHVTNRTAEPDGTYKRYWLPVNPALYGGDAGRISQAAAASTWRTTPGGKELFFEKWRDYRPAIET